MTRALFTSVSFLLAAVVLLATGVRPARADDKALAETLFVEGKEMVKQGKLVEACKRFGASHQAEESVGALLNLARCHHELGKTASAWREFKEAAALADRMNQPERKRGALDYAAKIEPTLSKLTVVAESPVQDMVVRRGGEVIPSAALGVAVAVDPGIHRIEASAPGHATWTSEIEVGAAKDAQTITVPPLEPKAQQGSASARDASSEGLHPRAIAGLVVAGVGVASLAAGIVLGVVAIDKDRALMCDGTACSSEEYAKVEDIEPIAHAATATIAIGAAAIIGGGILFLTAPSARAGQEPAQTTIRAIPLVSPTFQGLGLVGRF